MADKDYNEVDDRRLAYRVLSYTLASTTSPLNNAETYTGTSFDCDGFEYVLLSFYADQDALVRVQYTNDGNNWDAQEEHDYTGGNRLGMEVKVMGSKARIEIENDSGVDMTEMRMHAKGRV